MTGYTLRNPARERLEAGELALGIGIRQSRHVSIARAMKTAGFDFLFLDMEHSALPLDTVGQISVAALDAGIAPLVRVPELDHQRAARALGDGALGVVMPNVQNAEEARAIAACHRFPPLGNRTSGGPLVHFGFDAVPADQARPALNDATLITVMIERQATVEQADSIAAVEGVDVVMLGIGDLTADLGISGQAGHDDIVAAFETVGAACRKHGKWLGMGGVGSPEMMAKYIDMGTRFILAGSETNLLIAGGRRRCEDLREAL
ncbi:MAG: aldolase/citrate lyase family protein [Alphaproteobacteria bacterium]